MGSEMKRINVMKYWAVGLTLIAVVAIMSGCSMRSSSRYARSQQPRRLNPYLLFDRIPGKTYADSLQPRAIWPSAPGGRSITERVLFQEYYIDQQGQNQRPGQELQRRFTSRRIGIIERTGR